MRFLAPVILLTVAKSKRSRVPRDVFIPDCQSDQNSINPDDCICPKTFFNYYLNLEGEKKTSRKISDTEDYNAYEGYDYYEEEEDDDDEYEYDDYLNDDENDYYEDYENGTIIAYSITDPYNEKFKNQFRFLTNEQPAQSDKCITEIKPKSTYAGRSSKTPRKSRWDWEPEKMNFKFPTSYPERHRSPRAAIMNWPNVDYEDGEEIVNKEVYNKREIDGKGKYKKDEGKPCSDDEPCSKSLHRVNKVQCSVFTEWDGKQYQAKTIKKIRWSHQTDENGQTVIPIAYHWSFPKCLRKRMTELLKEMEKDFGCLRFEEEEYPRKPTRKYGILLVYEIKAGGLNGLCQTGSFKGLTHQAVEDKFREYRDRGLATNYASCNDYMKDCVCNGETDDLKMPEPNHDFRMCTACNECHWSSCNYLTGICTDCRYKNGHSGTLTKYAKKLREEYLDDHEKSEENVIRCAPKEDLVFKDGRKDSDRFNAAPELDELGNTKFKLNYRSSENKQYNQMATTWQILHFSTSCFSAGVVQHEMMHALGWLHEQADPQRSQFVEATEKDFRMKSSRGPSAYRMLNPKGTAISPYPFEVGSLLLYGPEVLKCKDGSSYRSGCKCNGKDPSVFVDNDCPNKTPCDSSYPNDIWCDPKTKKACYPEDCDKAPTKCKCSGITFEEYEKLKQNGFEVYKPISLKSEFLKEDKSLWVKNRKRTTTTDAFNIDWFFCKAFSSFMPNKVESKDITNRFYINKETVDCPSGDRVKINRPVFKDRLCDGFVDCYNGEDEDGTLAECRETTDFKTVVYSWEDSITCPTTIRMTHHFIDNCTIMSTEEINAEDNDLPQISNVSPIWRCWQGFENRAERRLYWSPGVDKDNKPISYDFKESSVYGLDPWETEAKGKSGWVLVETWMEDNKVRYTQNQKSIPWAVHLDSGKDCDTDDKRFSCKPSSCPPTDFNNNEKSGSNHVPRQWKFTEKKLYNRVYSFSHFGVAYPEMPTDVTVCGDSTGNFNGFYTRSAGNIDGYYSYTGGDNVIFFDQKNKAWALAKSADKLEKFYYYTTGLVDGKFELISQLSGSPSWRQTTSEQGGALPGYFASKSYEWTDPNLSFHVHSGNVNCGYSLDLKDEIYVCDQNPKWFINGKYQLRSTYYVMIENAHLPEGILPVIYWNVELGSWLITTEAKMLDENDNTGWLYKEGNLVFDQKDTNWKVFEDDFGAPNDDDSEAATLMLSDKCSCIFRYNPLMPVDLPSFKVESAERLSWPKEFYIFGSPLITWDPLKSQKIESVDGKYELQIDQVNRLPSYKRVKSKNMDESSVYILYLPRFGGWMINDRNDKYYGRFFKKNFDLFDGAEWEVSLGASLYIDSALAAGAMVPSRLSLSKGEIPSDDLPVRLFVCNEVNFFTPEIIIGHLNGEYRLNIESTDGRDAPYYESKYSDTFIYYNKNRGSWIIGWDRFSDYGWYEKDSWHFEDAPWVLNKYAGHYAQMNTPVFVTVSTAECTEKYLRERSTVYVCDGDTFKDGAEFKHNTKSSKLVNGKLYYEGEANQKKYYLMWQGSNWIINDDLDVGSALYRLSSIDLFDSKTKWMESEKKTSPARRDYWVESDLMLGYLGYFECSDQVQLYWQSTTSEAESTTSTVITTTYGTDEPVTAFNHATECAEMNTAVQWIGSDGMSEIQFQGESSIIIKTSIWNNLDFDIWENQYVGFMTFSQSACGMKVLDGLSSGELSWSIVDKGHFYNAQFAYLKRDGDNSDVTLQFFRHKHSHDEDAGSTDRDILYLVIDGLDEVNVPDLTTCFTGFDVGIMEVNEFINPELNHAKCAAWTSSIPF